MLSVGTRESIPLPIFLLHLHSLLALACSDSGPGLPVLSMNVCDQAFYNHPCSDSQSQGKRVKEAKRRIRKKIFYVSSHKKLPRPAQ